VIDALARKGKVRVVDGLTAASDLGLTDAVPARIGVLTDGRLRPITLGNLTLDFQAASSRLYWAGRPAMRFVQALHWLRAMLPSDDGSLRKLLVSILKDPNHGQGIQDDLRSGLSALPEWMRVCVYARLAGLCGRANYSNSAAMNGADCSTISSLID
jgi:hypothetical protein